MTTETITATELLRRVGLGTDDIADALADYRTPENLASTFMRAAKRANLEVRGGESAVWSKICDYMDAANIRYTPQRDALDIALGVSPIDHERTTTT